MCRTLLLVGLFAVILGSQALRADEPPAPMPASKGAPEAAPPAKPADEVPADWLDPAFDRHVDVRLLRQAWAKFDSALMADCGLQLAEGERVLLRPHRAFPAGKVLALAAKMAAERGDKETLARLGRAAESVNSSELKSALKDAEGKPAAEAAKLSVDEMTPDGLRTLQGALAFVRRAKLMRDPELLAQMEKALPQVPDLGSRGRQIVQAELQASRAAMPKPPEPGKRAFAARDATAIRLNAVLPPCAPANPAACN